MCITQLARNLTSANDDILDIDHSVNIVEDHEFVEDPRDFALALPPEPLPQSLSSRMLYIDVTMGNIQNHQQVYRNIIIPFKTTLRHLMYAIIMVFDNIRDVFGSFYPRLTRVQAPTQPQTQQNETGALVSLILGLDNDRSTLGIQGRLAHAKSPFF